MPKDPLDKKTPQRDLSKEEKDIMRKDAERIEHFKSYRRKFEQQMHKGAQMWNMLSDPAPRDDIANIYIGIARMIGQASITAMSQGRPDFGFRPGAPSDRAKVPFWESGIDHILNLSNYDAKQLYFLTDHTVIGMGIFEVVPQIPMRKKRFKNDSGFEEVWKRDFSRSKVEVRHRSPFEVWLDPSAPTLDDVRVTYDEQYIHEDTFNLEYKHAITPDGHKKYKNLDLVEPGKELGFGENGELMYRDHKRADRIVVGKLQDEKGDVLRLYASGVPILDESLQIKDKGNGQHTQGMNVLGKHSFCLGGNEHQYDTNLRTHSLYSMGLPYTMRGFDALYQALTNMTVDNIRLSNTNLISYQANDGLSALDMDSRDFYSGDFVDGTIDVHSLGNSNLQVNQAMWDQIDNWAIQLTGVNFKQLFDTGAKTAFELSQRIRAQNARFEHKLTTLENGGLKKLGQLALSGVMSELTAEDWEELTEKEIKLFADKIAKDEISGDDFEKKNGKLSRRKVRTTLRIKGRKMEESFKGKEKKRKFSPDSLDNTLLDFGKSEDDSFVEAAPEYVWSVEYMEQGALPDVYVTSARMLGDDQDLRFAKINATSNYARQRLAEDPTAKWDMNKIDKEYVDVLKIEPDEVFKEEDEDDDISKKLTDLQEFITNPQDAATPPGQPSAPNSPSPQIPAAPNISQAGDLTAGGGVLESPLSAPADGVA